MAAFDDECDDGSGTAGLGLLMWPVLRALDAPTADATGYSAALRDLRDRILALATPELPLQFAEGLRATLLTELVHTAQTSDDGEPTYDESLATRGRTSSPAWAFPLLCHVAGCRGSAGTTLADPSCGVLLDITASIINWDNDFHSYDGDKSNPGNGRNLVSQVRVRLGWDEQDATTAAVALCNEVMALFLRLRDQLHRPADPDRQPFLAGLGRYLPGNLDWHELSGRYATTWISLVSEWDPVPCDRRLRTPAISWWWGRARKTLDRPAPEQSSSRVPDATRTPVRGQGDPERRGQAHADAPVEYLVPGVLHRVQDAAVQHVRRLDARPARRCEHPDATYRVRVQLAVALDLDRNQ
ncbi:hypothetical protein SAMN05421507_1472 [Lentzea jiangxiensis]|uniref:Terpene synthase family, metal binding domain n=1 Tax=Lentzea jiangxiensis TaxID=641025 RepID=A0A1H0X7P4_9PSEU|nr:hypothetical protein SAMN05421507_1472 [Lentzea jiangxiensis]